MFVSSPGQYYPGAGVEGTWLVAEVGATAGASQLILQWSLSSVGQHQAQDVWWQWSHEPPGGMSPRGDNLHTGTLQLWSLCAKCCHQMLDVAVSRVPGCGVAAECGHLTSHRQTAVSRCSSQSDNEGWLQWDSRQDIALWPSEKLWQLGKNSCGLVTVKGSVINISAPVSRLATSRAPGQASCWGCI